MPHSTGNCHQGWQGHRTQTTAFIPGLPHPHNAAWSSGIYQCWEWAQTSSALQFCKKNLDFNPTTCGCQQHLQKKEKTHKPLCIADCKLFLLIHYRLFQINSAYSFLYLCKISTFDPANIYVHILLAGTVFCTECNKVLFTGP